MMWLGLVAVLLAAWWVRLWRRARFEWTPSPGRAEAVSPAGRVVTVHFPAVDGAVLEGWLFLPAETAKPPPVVVMAPGLGGTKDGFLEPFAWAFVERGVAALVFDYRTFGGSGGLPRHWVAPPRHREDYGSAIDHVKRELEGTVDGRRIALWGSSFSGGTAVVTAASRDDVAAVIAQCPFLGTPPHMRPRGVAMARFVALATLDMVPGIPPVYVPLYGRPGEWAFATSLENPSVEDFSGPLGSSFWRALPRPPLGGWENRMLARGLATIDSLAPMSELGRLRCPVLFVAAEKDDMVPVAMVREAHRAVGDRGELATFDCGHFELYLGPHHAANARLQADFLAEVLLDRPADPSVSAPGRP